ncbi:MULTISPECIES: DUF3267 domain-containing protein [Gracilibacillus]|uniref:DUF3267 domain-containing protein n=1 Tax=Gracilibacillus TaxID=74385 RepID=UPI000825C2E2|nr:MULTISPECIES: DUF3267 domain-containing protein [Gracilibacillus]
MNLELLKEINIIQNKKLVVWLNIWSIIIFVLLIALGLFILPAATIAIHIIPMLLFLLAMFVMFCFHELIHGMFFKMFAPGSKVKYGIKSGMFYAANPGVTYSKLPFVVIILMPFFIISCLLVMLSLFPINLHALYVLFAIHTAGCVGDFYYIGVLNNRSLFREQLVVEDTDTGIKIYRNGTTLEQ